MSKTNKYQLTDSDSVNSYVTHFPCDVGQSCLATEEDDCWVQQQHSPAVQHNSLMSVKSSEIFNSRCYKSLGNCNLSQL